VWFSNCTFIFFRKQKLPLCGKKERGEILRSIHLFIGFATIFAHFHQPFENFL
jgi:hypothetical protein